MATGTIQLLVTAVVVVRDEGDEAEPGLGPSERSMSVDASRSSTSTTGGAAGLLGERLDPQLNARDEVVHRAGGAGDPEVRH